jgi:hypothetical protein
MPLPSDAYWIEDAESDANTALNIDHVVPAGQQPVLQYLYAEASNGGNPTWSLQRAAGTVVLQGFCPVFIDFGLDGLKVPGTAGADLRLAIGAGGDGITTRGWIVGVDMHQG